MLVLLSLFQFIHCFFRYEAHYSVPIGRRKSAADKDKSASEMKAELATKFTKKGSKAVKRKFALRKKMAKVCYHPLFFESYS